VGIQFDVWFVVVVGTLAMLGIAVTLIVVIIISKRKALEATQRELERVAASEKKYRDLFENSLVGMARFSVTEKKIVDANEALLCIFRTDSMEEITKAIYHTPPSYREIIREKIFAQGFIDNEEYCMRRPDGSELWVSFSANYFQPTGILEGVVVDITERKHAEQQVQEQADLLNKTQDAVMVLDLHQTVRYWNAGAEKMYGRNTGEAIGKNVTEVMPYSKLAVFDDLWKSTLNDGHWSGEIRQRSQTGKEFVALCRSSLVRDQHENPIDVMIICTDVTENKRLQERFLRTQRIESIGVLTSGIAHDLSNDFAPMIMGVEMMKNNVRDDLLRPVIAAMDFSVQHGKKMIDQVLSYVKGAEGSRVELRPALLLAEVQKVVQSTFPESIHFAIQVPEDVLNINVDVGQLHQVFLNLLKNARDAMPDGGEITIKVINTTVGYELAENNPDAVPGKFVQFAFHDTGCGIPPSDVDRIFEPFYTTKEIGKGTGLGLSNAIGIVKGHKGFITVESEVGKGSTFYVYLPVFQKSDLQKEKENDANR
jgi:two-component system, cell cycle sensor histidine kinase and response regulator CckA